MDIDITEVALIILEKDLKNFRQERLIHKMDESLKSAQDQIILLQEEIEENRPKT